MSTFPAMRLGEVKIDLDRRTAQRGRDTAVALTGLEARLLAHLARIAPAPATHEELLTEVWQVRPTTQTQVVSQAIRRLRVKIEVDPSRPALILSESGVGYRLAVTPQSAGRPHNLPLERDGFVGRVRELEVVRRLWESDGRLVTITGFGGIGKTRLALRAGRQWPTHAVWFVDLTQARADDDVIHLVGATLGVPTQPVAITELVEAIGEGLVIVDNAEHVLEPVQRLVDQCLEAGPGHFLVTTRQRLSLPGEHVLRLGPLEPSDAEALWRARVTRDLTQPDDDDAVIRTLTDRLDRIPLAVELAAARRDSLSPKEILASLDDLLVRGARHGLRQGTLSQCITWSWDLLSSAERSVLAQVAVFRGGFTRSLASEVVELPADAPPLTEVLASLVDQSLLRADTRGDATRFRLYVVLAEHVSDEHILGPLATVAEAARRRHATSFAQRCSDAPDPHANSAYFAELVPEVDNLRAALDTAVALGEPVMSHALVSGLTRTVGLRHPSLVRRAVALAKPLVTDDVPRWAELSLFGGAMASLMYDLTLAERTLQEALDQPIDDGLRGRVLIEFGNVAFRRNQFSLARDRYVEASRCLESGASAFLGAALDNVARMDTYRGDFDAAVAGHERAIAVHRKHGRIAGEARCVGALAALNYRRGEVDLAHQRWQSTIGLSRDLGMADNELTQLLGLAKLELHRENLDEARAYSDRALVLSQQLQSPALAVSTMTGRAAILFRQGELAEAHRLLTEAADKAKRLGLGFHVAFADQTWAQWHFEQGRLEEAAEYAQGAIAGFAKLREPLDLAIAWAIAGRVALAGGDRTTAEAAAREADAAWASTAQARRPDVVAELTALHDALTA